VRWVIVRRKGPLAQTLPKRAEPFFQAPSTFATLGFSATFNEIQAKPKTWETGSHCNCKMAVQQLHFGRTKSVVKRSKKYLEEALYVRLFREGSSEVSVRHQLNQFLKSNERVYKWEVGNNFKRVFERKVYYPKRVYKWEVGDTLKKLRERKLYYPALKVLLLKPSNLVSIYSIYNYLVVALYRFVIC
jgi:hypothetical protein